MNIGDNIKNIRINKEITQKELAEKLNVTIRTVQNYESNNREPNIQMLNNIAKCLNVTIYDLLGSETTPVDIARMENFENPFNKNLIFDYPIDKTKFLSILAEKNLTIDTVSDLAQVSLKRIKSIVEDDMPTMLIQHLTRLSKALDIDESDLILNSNGMSTIDMNLKYFLENYLKEKGLSKKSAKEKSDEIIAIINTMINHSLK